eukprot:TRINITY_DN3353_c0_g2_i2.p1 TRINITY_DN3353_c0_g2~~TRINITY_DN3353_c0_g2_i2.p1  ORF type:complete len:893 (+),score=225.98 TRINITY_DN3353_c0_g2_i2:168-2846(+)
MQNFDGMCAPPLASGESLSSPVNPYDRARNRASNTVYKSGPLYISSKGIGWKSWKKRWFILTRTSLVFFKNDPNALPQKSGEVNLTLGGIDLNNSGSVVVRADKKLLTVLFPDGRDGRAFTLKAETLDDLIEWKTALEHALAQAPNAALVMGQNGIFHNDSLDGTDVSAEPWREKRPVKSLVVGRPILLALEDIDGSPSFLEKALCFIEKHGVKVEGILRLSADVEEVERRVHEYEQGRNQFLPDEDAHVVGDCIKHVLRELPSSPVPAPCCTALLEAQRMEDKESRISAMQLAIAETFPEPNRRLLQRILKMMQAVAARKAENRMTPSAVAACMAPLLLRPLLAGECEFGDDMESCGDSSSQLIAAATAATNAQAIVTTLLEEYNSIFADDHAHQCPSPQMYPQMEDSGSEGSLDDDVLDIRDNGYHNVQNGLEAELEDDPERVLSGTLSESSGNAGSDLYDYKVFEGGDSDVEYHIEVEDSSSKKEESKDSRLQCEESVKKEQGISYVQEDIDSGSLSGKRIQWENISSPPESPNVHDSSIDSIAAMGSVKASTKANGSLPTTKRSAFWNRASVNRKTQPAELNDSSGEEEVAIQRLEMMKNDLSNKIAKEARGNAILQASLERRKQALHERRLALEQDVARLQEQLQAERDLRAALEVGLSMSSGQFSSVRSMDSKTQEELEEIALAEADVARLKQKVAELHVQLNQQQQHYGSLMDSGDCLQHAKGLQAQQKASSQKNVDLPISLCQHEKVKHEQDGVLGNDWRTPRPPSLSSCIRNKVPWRHQMELMSPVDSKSTEASTSLSTEDITNDLDVSSTKPSLKEVEMSDNGMCQRQPVASSALVELTTRLDFFKERRSQLVEQLQNLDLSCSPGSHGYMCSASPPWASPR